jgi:hypothetical protein
MAPLVNDLLDLASVTSGRIALVRRLVATLKK